MSGPRCTCLPLNRKLMAVLLKVDEGSVHEQGCVENAAAEAGAAERARIAFEVGLLFSEWVAKQPDDEDILEVERAAILAAIEGESQVIGTPSAKWTCDRCGLFEHVPTGGQPTKWVGVSVATPPSRDLDGVSRLHLCAFCGALLIAWLEPLNTCAPEGESK